MNSLWLSSRKTLQFDCWGMNGPNPFFFPTNKVILCLSRPTALISAIRKCAPNINYPQLQPWTQFFSRFVFLHVLFSMKTLILRRSRDSILLDQPFAFCLAAFYSQIQKWRSGVRFARKLDRWELVLFNFGTGEHSWTNIGNNVLHESQSLSVFAISFYLFFLTFDCNWLLIGKKRRVPYWLLINTNWHKTCLPAEVELRTSNKPSNTFEAVGLQSSNFILRCMYYFLLLKMKGERERAKAETSWLRLSRNWNWTIFLRNFFLRSSKGIEIPVYFRKRIAKKKKSLI